MINKDSILNGSKYILYDGSQNYLVFQPIARYFTSKKDKIASWQSKGMSEESIKLPSTADNSFDPLIIFNYGQVRVKF